MVDDRRREAIEIERQAKAMRALRRAETSRNISPRERDDRSLLSSVRRFVRAAAAVL